MNRPELYDWATEPTGPDYASMLIALATSALLGTVIFLTLTGGVA